MPLPIRHLVPLENENGWSDLLAALIETDPVPVAQLLDLGSVAAAQVRVRRETTVERRDRIDLLIDVDGTLRTAVEAKVLSGLGRDQLARDRSAWPDATRYVLLTPQDFPIQLDARSQGWQVLAWETRLQALSGSADDWVARTARAWLAHIDDALPRLHGDVRWNDLQPGDSWVLNMRARMAWVFAQLDPPDALDELVALGTLTSQAAAFLEAAIVAGLNVIVAGGTQAGKTTLVECSA